MGVYLISNEKMRLDGFKLSQSMFRFDIRKIFFIKGVVIHWNKLSVVSESVQEASGCGTWIYGLGVILVVLD